MAFQAEAHHRHVDPKDAATAEVLHVIGIFGADVLGRQGLKKKHKENHRKTTGKLKEHVNLTKQTWWLRRIYTWFLIDKFMRITWLSVGLVKKSWK